MKMVKADALMSWSHLKESRTLDASEYVECPWVDGIPPPYKLLFVSHRWITAEHPDPDGSQLMELKQRLSTLPIPKGKMAHLLIFFDYCSLPQLPRSAEEELWFERDLHSLESLSHSADYFIILSEGYRDYVNRAWCFFEGITARGNTHFFSDQNHIKEELEIWKFLMTEDIKLLTSYDFSYKLDISETEIIVAVFQHLQSCKVTQPKDAPKIKEQLIAHYNKRRLKPFGKLIVGIIQHFDVEFAIMPVEGSREIFMCKPFFEHPDWVRLPSLDSRYRLMGGRPGPSMFALPREMWEDIWRRYSRFHALLRLSIPGVYNFETFLEDFRNKPDWKEYVVDPDMLGLGEKGDCFPAIDNVIHTVLELPPGFFISKDRQYLYFFLSERQEQEEPFVVQAATAHIQGDKAQEFVFKGLGLAQLGRFEEAVERFNRALDINPKLPEAWLNMGIYFNKLGENEGPLERLDRALESLKYLDKTLEIDPSNTEAWLHKGLQLSLLGKFDEALQCFDEALKLDPTMELAKKGKEATLKLKKESRTRFRRGPDSYL